MWLYAARRVVLAVPLLIGITCISFVVLHLAPGEPVETQTGDLSVKASAQAKQALRELYGLDKPLYQQYGTWLARIARLDFGRSFAPDAKPVLQKIGERLPITIFLNVVEMLVIIALAVPVGILSATHQYSGFDKLLTVFVFVGFATPNFWLALLLMISGSVIVESIFAIPGIGQLMVQAVVMRDYPVIMGNLVIVSTLALGANLIAYIAYVLVDPGIRIARRRR